MGSVLESIQCPRCNEEASLDFYYKTGEEYVQCTNCGYQYSATIKNRDKRLDELTDDDWEIVEVKQPYAAYRIKGYDGIGYMGGTIKDETDIEEIKNSLKLENIETFTISQLIDGKIVETVIIDNGPKVDSAGFTEQDR